MKTVKKRNDQKPLTLSDKYQVVIPKEARKKLGIKPGQFLTVKSVGSNSITFERQPSMKELLEKGYGTMKDTPWQKEGIDAADWLRRERDAEDEHRNKVAGRL